MIIESRRGSSTILTPEKPCLEMSFDGCSDGTLWLTNGVGVEGKVADLQNFLMGK